MQCIFISWENTRVWAYRNYSFNMHLRYLQASTYFSSILNPLRVCSQGAVVSDGLNILCLLKWLAAFFLHSKIHLYYRMSFLWALFFFFFYSQTLLVQWEWCYSGILFSAELVSQSKVLFISLQFQNFGIKLSMWVLSCFSHVCDSMDCSPTGSSVHGILQARILERVAMPSSRRSSQARDRTRVSYISCNSTQVLYH